jgi:hypothetical protein
LVAHNKVLSFVQSSSGCPKRFGVQANSARTHLSHSDERKSSRAKFEGCGWEKGYIKLAETIRAGQGKRYFARR